MAKEINLQEEICALITESKGHNITKGDASGMAARICKHWNEAKDMLPMEYWSGNLRTQIETVFRTTNAISSTPAIEPLKDKIHRLILNTAGLTEEETPAL